MQRVEAMHMGMMFILRLFFLQIFRLILDEATHEKHYGSKGIMIHVHRLAYLVISAFADGVYFRYPRIGIFIMCFEAGLWVALFGVDYIVMPIIYFALAQLDNLLFPVIGTVIIGAFTYCHQAVKNKTRVRLLRQKIRQKSALSELNTVWNNIPTPANRSFRDGGGVERRTVSERVQRHRRNDIGEFNLNESIHNG